MGYSQTVPESFLEIVVDDLIRLQKTLLSGQKLRYGALLQHAWLTDCFGAEDEKKEKDSFMSLGVQPVPFIYDSVRNEEEEERKHRSTEDAASRDLLSLILRSVKHASEAQE